MTLSRNIAEGCRFSSLGLCLVMRKRWMTMIVDRTELVIDYFNDICCVTMPRPCARLTTLLNTSYEEVVFLRCALAVVGAVLISTGST